MPLVRKGARGKDGTSCPRLSTQWPRSAISAPVHSVVLEGVGRAGSPSQKANVGDWTHGREKATRPCRVVSATASDMLGSEGPGQEG
jgi:hypothetical protein